MIFKPQANATLSKLNQFATMEPGWHYGCGVAPSKARIARARSFLTWYHCHGLTETDAFCSADGDVMVTAYDNSRYLEIDINAESTAAFRYLVDEQEQVDESELPDQDVFQYVAELQGEACGTSGLSIPTPMTTTERNLTVTRLSTLAQDWAAEAQAFSNLSVQRRKVVYATTSINSIKASAEIRRFSGFSSMANYRRVAA